MNEPLVQLEHITFRYGEEGQPVLEDVNLTVGHGESIAILGPSGCGKSTLLNIIGTLERPASGQVLLDGLDVWHLGTRALARLRNSRIGFVFQDHHLLPQCTLLENVLVPTLAGDKAHRGECGDRPRRLLERAGLADRMHHRPGEVSGGQRQRTAVVRALINRPALVLADEPTGSLDRAASDNLARLLVELNTEEQVAMIVVTHSPGLAAMMHRQYELRDGKLQERHASPTA